jgi:signal transduction histidine kinase
MDLIGPLGTRHEVADAIDPVDSAALDAVRTQPAPQLVLRLDALGRVIDIEAALAADSFSDSNLQCGISAHRSLHPNCADSRCVLRSCLRAALARIDAERVIEWELPSVRPGTTARLHLRRAGLGARTWATLTVTDITAGRLAAAALREVNRVLTQIIDKTEPDHAKQVLRLDRKLRTLTGELIVAQESERHRLAAELHDGLGQWLSMAKLCIETGLHKLGDSPARANFERAFSHLRTAIHEVRAIVRNLRPSMLEEFGLVPTLELLCHELQVSRPQLDVHCRIRGNPANLSSPQCIAIVRILQEAINNVAKHSMATTLHVRVDFMPTQSRLSIRDNGQGIAGPAEEEVKRRGVGLGSMRERALQTGGQFRLVSKAEAGTKIVVTWQHRDTDADLNSNSGTYKAIGDGVGSHGSSVL